MINKIDCFGVDGEEGMKIEPQSMLPDVSDFELLGQELKGGCDCQKWQKIEKVMFMTNTKPDRTFCSDWGEDEQVHNLGGHVGGLPGAEAL